MFDYCQTTFKPVSHVVCRTKQMFDNTNQRLLFIEILILLDCVHEVHD